MQHCGAQQVKAWQNARFVAREDAGDEVAALGRALVELARADGEQLTAADLAARVPELTVGQLIGLRFAIAAMSLAFRPAMLMRPEVGM